MAKVKKGDTVRVHFTGRLKDGTVFDSSVEREPYEFTVGKSGIIPGFEQAVIGMKPGETKTAKIPAAKAYGPRRKDMIAVVDRSKIPTHLEPETGLRLQINQADGSKVPVKIIKVSGSKVTLDANHPLAGKDLTFDIELKEIV
jgi:FKBP-type peptidyl-prolyl cis-trans isomerase 2